MITAEQLARWLELVELFAPIIEEAEVCPRKTKKFLAMRNEILDAYRDAIDAEARSA